MRAPTITVSAERVCKMMRHHRVRIADIVTAYDITTARVRQVRREGGPWDWPMIIQKLSRR